MPDDLQQYAYFVAFMQRRTRRIVWAGVYRDPDPPCGAEYVPMLVASYSAASYGAAYQLACDSIAKNPASQWAREVMSVRDGGDVQRR